MTASIILLSVSLKTNDLFSKGKSTLILHVIVFSMKERNYRKRPEKVWEKYTE